MLIALFELFVANSYFTNHTSISLFDSTDNIIMVNICSRDTPECIISSATVNYKFNSCQYVELIYKYIRTIS